jgi:outer membrane biosynthesis protein TonB
MTKRFWRYFWRVAAVHGVILLLLLVVPALMRLIRKKTAPVVMPIEFLVEVPRTPPPPVPDLPPVIPKPDPIPKPKPKPKPKPRAPIRRSTNLVTRTSNAPKPKPKPTLTAKQIQDLLDEGAKPSDRTSIPGEDARCMDIIRRRLYSAWSQPTGFAGDTRVAEVALTLRSGGKVAAWNLVKSSGSSEFDATVKSAAGSIGRIDHLTDGFISRHPTVTIAFRVE